MWIAFTHHWLVKALRPILRAIKLRVKSFFIYEFVVQPDDMIPVAFARPPPEARDV